MLTIIYLLLNKGKILSKVFSQKNITEEDVNGRGEK